MAWWRVSSPSRGHWQPCPRSSAGGSTSFLVGGREVVRACRLQPPQRRAAPPRRGPANAAAQNHPQLSRRNPLPLGPHGSRLLAESGGNLYVGAPPHPLRRIGAGCIGAWSPDATRFAYASNGWALAARADGTRIRRLTPALRVEDWSSDGKRLALIRRRRSECEGKLAARVFIFRFSDGGTRQLTSETREFGAAFEVRGDQLDASFSPNGRQVAFTERIQCRWLASVDWNPMRWSHPATSTLEADT